MATAIVDQIERQFAELPSQTQRAVVQRLVHLMQQANPEDEEALALATAEMAEDPQIQRELAEMDREFRVTENDGLANL